MVHNKGSSGRGTIVVNIFEDQWQRRLIRFCQGGKTAYVPEVTIAGHVNILVPLLPLLAERGIVSLDGHNELALAIKQLGAAEGTVVVAERPGWVALSSFAYPSGTICTSGKRSQDAIVNFPLQSKFRFRGTKAGWSEGLRPHLEGNTVLQFLLGLGLTPVLLRPFSQILDLQNNIGFQINGPSSRGKTTGARLAGSIWGGDPDKTGNFMETWRTTMNGLETTMQVHSDTLLILDEANLAGSTATERAKFQAEAVFMLDTGRAKGRFGDADSSLTRLTVISTSNAPLAGSTSHSEADAAVQVRMPSLDVGRRTYGILDRPGEGGAAATISAIDAIIRSNYGWAARTFVRVVTLRRSQSEAALVKSLSGSMQKFKQAADFEALTPQQQRVCKTFAFIHATAHLAAECRVIPLTVEEALASTLSVYREVAHGMRSGAEDLIARFEALLDAQRSVLADLSVRKTPAVSGNSGSLGQLRTNDSNGIELLVKKGAPSQQLGLTKAVLAALRGFDALIFDKPHRTTKRAGIEGRLYVIRLDASRFPRELKVLRGSNLELKAAVIGG